MNETIEIDAESTTGDTSSKPDFGSTDATRRRYQRIASIYDVMKGMAEIRYRPWRERLWSLVPGLHLLEAGVGTGKNMPYYPSGISIAAVDLTPGMLQRAQNRIGNMKLQSKVDLRLGDVQQLDFPEAVFDSAVATFVFCSLNTCVPPFPLSEL